MDLSHHCDCAAAAISLLKGSWGQLETQCNALTFKSPYLKMVQRQHHDETELLFWCCHFKLVSSILSLEAQELAGEILSQIMYLLLVTGKVWHSGLKVIELSQEIHQPEPRYVEIVHIYLLHVYLTEVVLTRDRV